MRSCLGFPQQSGEEAASQPGLPSCRGGKRTHVHVAVAPLPDHVVAQQVGLGGAPGRREPARHRAAAVHFPCGKQVQVRTGVAQKNKFPPVLRHIWFGLIMFGLVCLGQVGLFEIGLVWFAQLKNYLRTVQQK